MYYGLGDHAPQYGDPDFFAYKNKKVSNFNAEMETFCKEKGYMTKDAVEKEIEKYKSVCSNMNLEEIKTQDYKYRKLVLYSSTLDIILSSVLDDNTSYAEGSVVDNIGELISYVRQNYPDYLEDLLWFYNIFMNKDQVQFIINKYNFPFTIKNGPNVTASLTFIS